MAKRKKPVTLSVAPLNLAKGAEAFEQVLARLEAVPVQQLVSVRVDLQLAASLAHSIALRDAESGRAARIEALIQAGVVDGALLKRLPTLALAAWHTRRKQLEATATGTSALLGEATLREAQAVRARMLRVLEYHFGEDLVMGPRLVAIRAGTGYQDLANDLLSVAELYEEAEIADVIGSDRFYDAKDVGSAREHASTLAVALGLRDEAEAARWTDLAQRAWTLMNEAYEELRAAGRLAFRHDEDVDGSYPSLVSAVRTPGVRDSKTEALPTNGATPSGGVAGQP